MVKARQAPQTWDGVLTSTQEGLGTSAVLSLIDGMPPPKREERWKYAVLIASLAQKVTGYRWTEVEAGFGHQVRLQSSRGDNVKIGWPEVQNPTTEGWPVIGYSVSPYEAWNAWEDSEQNPYDDEAIVEATTYGRGSHRELMTVIEEVVGES